MTGVMLSPLVRAEGDAIYMRGQKDILSITSRVTHMPVVEVAEALTEFFGILRGSEGSKNFLALRGEIKDLQV